ncbi:hypothetical protein HOV93_45220 [Planctomycetes bacterium FF15]|uniref:Uncharacterized protein n=1 Tax=Bremerella alba TaxID=980252 RepID=A0A7V8V9A1_9BACT|nr:hypothetical protein [Bremerella alba]
MTGDLGRLVKAVKYLPHLTAFFMRDLPTGTAVFTQCGSPNFPATSIAQVMQLTDAIT